MTNGGTATPSETAKRAAREREISDHIESLTRVRRESDESATEHATGRRSAKRMALAPAEACVACVDAVCIPASTLCVYFKRAESTFQFHLKRKRLGAPGWRVGAGRRARHVRNGGGLFLRPACSPEGLPAIKGAQFICFVCWSSACVVPS
jgi:hypothetical protein